MSDSLTSVFQLIKPEINVSTTWPTSLNADMDTLDSELARPRIPHNSPTVSGTTTLDLSLARAFKFTLSQASTIAVTNVPANTFYAWFVAKVTNGGAFTLSYPASFAWQQGAPPTLQATGVDFLYGETFDAGTTWYVRHLNCRIPYQATGLSTTSSSIVTLATYTLPANALAVNGQALRITMMGRASTQSATPTIRFGASDMTNSSVVPAGQFFCYTALLVRTGAATQRSVVSQLINNDANVGMGAGNHAETLSAAVNIDFRGVVTAGGTFDVDLAMVERLLA